MSAVALQSFGFEGNTVRVMDQHGAPWFVAQDVCSVLQITNHRNVVAALDDDEKGVHTMDTLGGPQLVQIVSESGLYALIFKSRKPAAIRFRKWVTAELLPVLRVTGKYLMPSAANDQPPSGKPLENLETQAGREQARIMLVAIRETRCIFGNSAAGSLWIRLGFPPPEHVALPKGWEPSPKYLFTIDAEIALWRDNRLVETAPDAPPVETSKLYADYRAWCGKRLRDPVDHSTFGKNLSALGIAVSYNKGSWRLGVALAA